VNTDIIQDNENGMLAASEEEWIKKLSILLESPERRALLGSAGRQTVEQKYTAVSQAPRVHEIFKSVARASRVTTKQVLQSASATDNLR
jgi:glycosyltransferase involved in cell wall biosynthesis